MTGVFSFSLLFLVVPMCEVGNQQTDEGSRDDELFCRTGDSTKLKLIDLTEMFGNVKRSRKDRI